MVKNITVIPYEASKALAIIHDLLAESLVAVYLHGSAIVGGLRPHSDVDLLIVINKPMTTEIRGQFAVELMEISGHYPDDPSGRRPLEVVVFLDSDLLSADYPAQSEFIYGEWLRHEFEHNSVLKPAADPEMALLLAQAKLESLSLSGPNANECLPIIPWPDIQRAISDSLPALIKSLQGDECNVLLTLARMWRTLVTREFVSKDAAAKWAIARLATEQAAVLYDAQAVYLGMQNINWNARYYDVQQTVNTLRDRILSHPTHDFCSRH